MSESARNVVVGAFVLSALFALILWLALLAGRTGATDAYYVHYDNVMGVAPGTRVLFEGYPIGTVSEVGPSPDAARRFRVDLEVSRGWPIPSDSEAAVTASGLLSAIVLDLRAGDSTEPLAPGSEIPAGSSRSVMAALSSVAGEVTELIDQGLKPLLSDIGAGAPEILADVQAITSQVSDATARLDEIVSDRNVASIASILSNLDGASGRLESVVADVNGTRARLDELLVSVNRLMDEQDGPVPQAAEDLRNTLAALASRFEVISYNAEVSSRNLVEFTRQIRENPGVLVRGRAIENGSAP